MIRQLCILSLFLIVAQGKPVTFDQRQDGKFNVHAQLDNIMIVIATPGDKGPSSLFSDIASQILELRSLTSRHKKVSIEDEEIVEEGKDPLNVRILRIESQNDAEENGSQSQGRGSLNRLNESEQPTGNQIQALDLPKIEDIKQIPNKTDEDIKEGIKEFHNKIEEIKVPILDITDEIKNLGEKFEKKEVLEKKGISQRDYSSKEEIQGDVEPIPKKQENIPIDPQIIPKSFEMQDLDLEKKPEKIVIPEKTPVIPEESEKISIVTLEEVPERIEEKEVLLKKLENQEEQIPVKIEKQEKTLPAKEKKKEEISGAVVDKVFPLSQRADRELRTPVSDAKGRMSLKKELPRIEDMKEVEAPGDKNEVRLIVEEMSQLKPIGDMIENCGPGRIRNRYGVCQFDESFN